MLSVTRFVDDRFKSNAYVVTRMVGFPALVIDPTDSTTGQIVACLEPCDCPEILIVLTHEHLDHISGVNFLRARLRARLICSRVCSEYIALPARNLSRYFTGVAIVCGPADMICEEIENELEWCGTRLLFLTTPGHSPGSICIAVENTLFTGDTIIQNSRTVTKLPGGSRSKLRASVDRILSQCEPDTLIYPGHGEPFRMKEIDPAALLPRELH